MSNQSAEEDDDARAHLEEIEPGAGCAEVWERLSERRSETAAASDDSSSR